MDCVSTVQPALNLRPRRPRGLLRPTKMIAGLGTVELVREERCHGWQMTKEFVPSRLTIVDQIMVGNESEDDARIYWETLSQKEPLARVRLATELFNRHQAGPPINDLDDILRSIDEWLVPYRISRSGNDYLVHYECTDAPAGTLLGSVLINALVTSCGTVSRIDTYGPETVTLIEAELRDAYRQRIVPDGCGFVVDSIADRLICAGYLRPTDEYWSLLSAAVEQTESLLALAEPRHHSFLQAALRMLNMVKSVATSRATSK